MTVTRLVYNNADNYANACKKSQRTAVVYIGCSGTKLNHECILYCIYKLKMSIYCAVLFKFILKYRVIIADFDARVY